MHLENLIDKKYDLLTANDREIIRTILQYKQKICGMNSIQLSQFLHVSRTTLVRLLKKLDIDTFAEFKLFLNREVTEETQIEFDMNQIVKDYHIIIDELKKYDYEKICQMIYESDTIYLYGTGNEQKAITEEFKRIFLILGKCCVDLFDLGEIEFAKIRFKNNSLFLAVSLSGETQEALDIVRCIQERKIQTISLTRWENNSLARMCQENLYVGTKTIQQTESKSYEMVAAFYIMLDILSVCYLEYIRKYREEGFDEDKGTFELSL